MKYYNRILETTLLNASKTFPACLVTGPRQSGKTTLLKNLFSNKAKFISLEEYDTRLWAIEDPRDFLENNKPPIIIDEIQYAPDLLTYIKRKIDDDRKPGQWFFTGSQQFNLMKNISESLAGRIAITNLLPFSYSEKKQQFYDNFQIWFDNIVKGNNTNNDLGNLLIRGFYPELLLNKKVSINLWYDSYIKTYLEKDLKTLYDVGNLNQFYKFLTLLASRTAQIINYSSFSNELGISIPTLKKWISILESSFIIYLLQPFYNNFGKRIIKSPKIYFLDTGLASYLTGITTDKILLNGPMSGALFETFVISEFIKMFYHLGQRPPIYYFNNKNIWEIDLLIFYEQILYPIEIKLTGTVNAKYLKNFNIFRGLVENISIKNYLICKDNRNLTIKNTHICYWGNL